VNTELDGLVLIPIPAIADYQYTPPQDTHVAQLVQSLIDLDCKWQRRGPSNSCPDDAILDYKVPPLHEEYTAPAPPGPNGEPPAHPFVSLLELQPTPVMSQRQLPHVFKWVFFS